MNQYLLATIHSKYRIPISHYRVTGSRSLLAFAFTYDSNGNQRRRTLFVGK